MKKITKKTKSPEIIVDCINFDTVADLYDNYMFAKIRAKKPITEEEVNGYVLNQMSKFFNMAIGAALYAASTCTTVCNQKKQPWYKRLWNWIRRK